MGSVVGETASFFRVLPVRSKDNNCGIALATYALRGGWPGYKRVKYDCVRDQLGIPRGGLLSYQEMDMVAEHFATNYVVYDIAGKRVHTGKCYDEDLGRNAELLLDSEHYTLILSQVGQCRCGKPDGEGHVCKYKSGFCLQCNVFHNNGAHDCPYSQDNIACRAIQSMAAAQLKREVEQRELEKSKRIEDSLSNMQRREEFEPILECIFKNRSSCLVLGPGGVGKTFVALYETKRLCKRRGQVQSVYSHRPGRDAARRRDHCALRSQTRLGTTARNDRRSVQGGGLLEWEGVTHLLLDEISMFDESLVTTMDLVHTQALQHQTFRRFDLCRRRRLLTAQTYQLRTFSLTRK